MADSRHPLLLYAYVAEWEYACCQAEPAVGQVIEWALEAVPAESDDRYVLVDLRWDERLDIVRFRGGSAGRSMHPADRRGPIALCATWHGVEAPVTVFGSVAEVAPADDGVVVGISVRRIVEPTPDEVDDARVRHDRDARTIGLTGAAEAFGEGLPAVGDRMAVDLADPRVSQTGDGRRTGVVHGVVRQVSRAEPTPSGGHYFYDLEPGAPAPADLFVALVCDE